MGLDIVVNERAAEKGENTCTLGCCTPRLQCRAWRCIQASSYVPHSCTGGTGSVYIIVYYHQFDEPFQL